MEEKIYFNSDNFAYRKAAGKYRISVSTYNVNGIPNIRHFIRWSIANNRLKVGLQFLQIRFEYF